MKFKTQTISIFIFFLLLNELKAQIKQATLKNNFSFDIGRSISGTGDQRGLAVSTSFTHQINFKTHYTLGVSTTIHKGAIELIYQLNDGTTIDGSIRNATGGVQIFGSYGISFLKSKRQELQINAGSLIRYQATSQNDGVSYIGPNSVLFPDYPFYVVSFFNKEPQESLAIGALLNLTYHYNLSEKIVLGLVPAFQLDTNGDTFQNVSLKLGYRF